MKQETHAWKLSRDTWAQVVVTGTLDSAALEKLRAFVALLEAEVRPLDEGSAEPAKCIQAPDEEEIWCKKDGSAHSIYCPRSPNYWPPATPIAPADVSKKAGDGEHTLECNRRAVCICSAEPAEKEGT